MPPPPRTAGMIHRDTLIRRLRESPPAQILCTRLDPEPEYTLLPDGRRIAAASPPQSSAPSSPTAPCAPTTTASSPRRTIPKPIPLPAHPTGFPRDAAPAALADLTSSAPTA